MGQFCGDIGSAGRNADDKRLGDGLGGNQRSILGLALHDPRISITEIANKIGISTTAVEKNITSLKEKKLLKRVGTKKGGHWLVINSSP
ncbi:MAG: hypothetical protein A2293_03520 [Elusimicrobia bacterium RIFOXYB2_FULL_49_7]|nr:MAG: hypothetical protein A2293_03520 [Elusimicrobia bacterium RIFOXYB2_FULL_49_7]